MNVIQEIQTIRNKILELDTAFAELIGQLENTNDNIIIQRLENYETIYPLTINPAIFKGKKPTAVTVNGERIEVRTWKMVVVEIMRHCNSDAERHVALMNLRGKISGQKRVLLAKNGDEMRSPIAIAENLYIETHYDTETLLRTLTIRILDVVGYDYNKIFVSTRSIE